jgi:RNA polymerase sigma-70 factor, ECF subfamily
VSPFLPFRSGRGRRYDDLSFEAIVEQARLGDARAFDVVAATFAAPLVRFTAAILSGDFDTAHDVVQEVLLAAWRSLPEMQEPRFLRAWLFRVAHRRAVSWLRRRGPRGARVEGLADHGIEEFSVPAKPEPPSPASESAATDGMRTMLGALPERYASPIALCYIEGLGLKETARVLDVSESTLKMRLHRGRELLRERIALEDGWTLHRRGPHVGSDIRDVPIRANAPMREDMR